MSPEQTFFLAIFSAVIGGIVSPVIIQYLTRKKTKSEAELNIAQSANEIAEGGERAVTAARQLLEFYEKRIKDLSEEVCKQAGEISALKALITSMQVDERAKELRLLAKIEALEKYIQVLIVELQKRDIDIPPRPDDLKDSNPKIKV